MTKGFTMIEMCFCFMISSIIILLVLLDCKTINKIQVEPSSYSDIVIASKQISQDLMEAKDIDVSNDSLTYSTKEQTFTIQLKNDIVVKEPGYVVILYDIDELHFENDDLIKMEVMQKEQSYEFYIGINKE